MHEQKKIISPLKAIRAKCLECSTGSPVVVKNCNIPECELFNFRFGKNPFRKKRILTDEQRKEIVERLSSAREQLPGKTKPIEI